MEMFRRSLNLFILGYILFKMKIILYTRCFRSNPVKNPRIRILTPALKLTPHLRVDGFAGVQLLLPQIPKFHQNVLVDALIKEAFSHGADNIVDHRLKNLVDINKLYSKLMLKKGRKRREKG